MKYFILNVVATIIIALSGCTKVVVKPIKDGTEAGITYYLPQPFIFVTPKEDGSLDVHPEIIADRSQGYAVSATSYLAEHKLIMEQLQGLLTKVTLHQDSSAVASELVKAAGEVESENITKKAEQQTKAQEKVDLLEKEHKTAITKIQEAIAQTEIELAQAKVALKLDNKPENVLAVKKLEAKLEALKIQLASAVSAELGSFSTEGNSTINRNSTKLTSHPGPAIFRIEEGSDGILKLIAINFEPSNVQKSFSVYKLTDGSVQNDSPKNIEFVTNDLGDLDPGSSNKEVVTKQEFENTLKITEMTGSQGKIDNNLWPDVERKNSKTFLLSFKNNMPDNYKITLIGIDKNSSNIEGFLTVRIK